MSTKKLILSTSIAVLVFVFVMNNPIMFGFCQNMSVTSYGEYCYDPAVSVPEIVSLLGIFLGAFLFILSLITYRMRDEVFRAWWGFARWWVPVIIAVTLFLQNAGGGGGWGLGSGGFDILILSIFYAIFVITSLVKIVRAYLKTR